MAAATGNERQARAIPNPILSYQREQTSGRGQDNSQSIASVDQPLDLAGRNARLAAAARRREAAEARLLDAAARLDLDVARVYAHVIASARRAELANDAAAAFARARRVSDERLQAGDISGYASRRVRLEAARYAALGAEANLSLRGARLALAGLLANDAADIMETDFELEAPAPSLVPIPSTDSLLALALTRRPDLRAAQLDAAAADAEVRVTSRSRIPAPVLTAGIKTERVGGGGDLSGFVAGIALPLPLWDRRGGAIDAAAADAKRAMAESELIRRRIAQEVHQAIAAVQAVDEELRVLSPELGDVAAAALSSAELAYAEGEIPLIEWLDAVRSYQEAESAFASLRAESLIRHAVLQRAVGFSFQRQVP